MTVAQEYDPLSKDVKQDQHSWFAKLRSECPVHHHTMPKTEVAKQNDNYLVASPTEEFWSVLTYQDAVDVLQDNKGFSSIEGPGPERMAQMSPEGMLLTADEPAHRRQRKIASKAFLPRIVNQRIPVIRKKIDDLVDEVGPKGECDLMWDLAFPLTAYMLTSFFGVGVDRTDDVARWGAASIAMMGGTPEQVDAGAAATMEFFAFLTEHIDDRRARHARGEELPDDLLSAMITARDDDTGTGFIDEEIMGAAHQFYVAGFETTATAIGNGVYRLLTNPEERKKLEADWSLLDSAVEEILRYDAPVEGTFRTTTCPRTVNGVEIPAGSKVRVVYASANRDAAKFENPDEFRIDRPIQELRSHLAFATGPHACLGSALARAQIKNGVETILRRLPGMQFDDSNPPQKCLALTVCGFLHIPIHWDPASVAPRIWDDAPEA